MGTSQPATNERFLWIWLGTVLAVVSLVADKHNNYVMAALPVFSLWAGRSFIGFAAWLGRPMRIASYHEAFLWTAGLLAAAIVAPTLAIRHIPELNPTGWIFSGILLGGACSLVWFLRSGRKISGGVVCLSAFLLCYVLVVARELPNWDHRRGAVSFAERVRSDVREGEEVVVYRMGMNPMVYYLDEPVQRIETQEALTTHLSRRKRLSVVTYDTGWYELVAAGEARLVYRSFASADMPDPKDGQLLLVELTVREEYQPSSNPKIGEQRLSQR